MMTPAPEDLASDPRALTLIHAAWDGLDDHERCDFNVFVLGALCVNLTADQVAAAIKIAKSCMARAAADRDEPPEIDHDRLTDAAQDGWNR